ncbi:PREDICTED: LOW QUALITY PROTEIN: uncharacterized protein LOC104799277 [Tarenaya hassleriana]|uniref:LOW QUALITY PROTEIN: uncharacterized protein LOC104799277 n=1 Tax=Tarenaya hassleriana TaxID=28532 RepID=UPI00053C5BC7|nr:PREDICTED: LOW QUALITY PROTEIN: uncharacterized protein LOC104799277 [Tarenaya hassleriana]
MSRLAPLLEEPIEEGEGGGDAQRGRTKPFSWRKWVKTHFSFMGFHPKSDIKVLLSVIGCPLFPVPPLPKISLHEVSSSAQYIIQHFTAATGCKKLVGRVKNTFVTGKIAMAMCDELGGGGGSAVAHKGRFVMWQMFPDKWLIELVAKGTLRPLRRSLQGLDPLTISSVFSSAQFVGEKQMGGDDCFVLKLSTDQTDLTRRSDSTAEMIKHVAFGYFSQRSGLLVYLDDSSLTRIQIPGTLPTYWETSMSTWIEDYKAIEGSEVVIAHSGRTNALISTFGDSSKGGISVTKMQETWSIDDVAFNVQGLSPDCFIAPKEIKTEFHPDRRMSSFSIGSDLID